MMPLLRQGELSRMRDAHRPGRPAAVMTIALRVWMAPDPVPRWRAARDAGRRNHHFIERE